MDIQMHELKLILQPIPKSNTQTNLFCPYRLVNYNIITLILKFVLLTDGRYQS